MPYNVQQEDLSIILQGSEEFFTKIQLLNHDFSIIDELSGVTISGENSVDASSDIRSTYSSSILVKDKSLTLGEYKKIWLDKYVRIFIGIKSIRTQEIKYYPMGIFLFNDNNFTYNENTNTLDISCLDLMCLLNGIRGGNLSKFTTLIPAGTNIREALVASITQLGGIQKYIIQDIGKLVPYDLEFKTGDTVFTVIQKLRDLYPAWESFFDVDGTFVCQEIPTCVNDDIVLDRALMSKLVISEQQSNSFSDIKNRTEIFGASLDADRIATTCTNTGSQYNITLDNFALSERIKIAFKPNVANLASATLQINALPAYGIYLESNEFIPVARLKANVDYVVRFIKDKFYLMGEFQTYGEAEDGNPSSPFYVGANHEYTYLQVLSGGEYDNIYSDELCQHRAEYENWKSTRMADGLDLEMKIVPWLGVNQKIEYTSMLTGETHEYLTKSIKHNTASGKMSVHLIRFYPLYPTVVNT